MTNPFSPGADTVPAVWAGRSQQVREWDDVVRPRLTAGLPERGRTILGEAGLGKSSLVRRIAAQAHHQGDWVTRQLRVPSGTDPLKKVASALLELADVAGLPTHRDRRLTETLSRVEHLSAAGVAVGLRHPDGPEAYSALTGLLIAIGEQALARDVVVLIHLDEVQNITDASVLSQLLICLGDTLAHQVTVTAPGGLALERHLPIAVYLTGLPDFADMASAKKGATFARRFATTRLEPLTDDDLRLALHPFVDPGWEVALPEGGRGVVHLEPQAVDAIVDCAQGEPFLFQLSGERAWYAGTGNVITAEEVRRGWLTSISEAVSHVERILERLPDQERRMVHTMASLPPAERTLNQIARAMGAPGGAQVGPTAQRLDTARGIIRRGSPYTFRHRAIEAYLTRGWPHLTTP